MGPLAKCHISQLASNIVVISGHWLGVFRRRAGTHPPLRSLRWGNLSSQLDNCCRNWRSLAPASAHIHHRCFASAPPRGPSSEQSALEGTSLSFITGHIRIIICLMTCIAATAVHSSQCQLRAIAEQSVAQSFT